MLLFCYLTIIITVTVIPNCWYLIGRKKTVWHGKIFLLLNFWVFPRGWEKIVLQRWSVTKNITICWNIDKEKTMQKRIKKNCLDTRKQRWNIFLISCYPSIYVCLFFQSTGFPNYWCYPLPVFPSLIYLFSGFPFIFYQLYWFSPHIIISL